MGFPGFDVDADQMKTAPTFEADVKKSAGPQPKQAPPSSVEMLKALVDDTTSAVKPLRGDVDHQFATAERIVSSTAELIAGRIPAVTSALMSNPGDVTQVSELLQQLDKQLNILFMVARRHRISLRGAHLDTVFDGEDRLRQAGGQTPLYRADNYYDETGLGGDNAKKETNDPTSDTLNSGKSTEDKPQSRDDLITLITGFGTKVSNAMDSGRSDAEKIINEPGKPKSPELMEIIMEAALDFAINAATGMAGALIKDMMKGAPKMHVGEHEKGGGEEEDEELGHEMVKVLGESLGDAAKGGVKSKLGGKEKEGDEPKEGSEPKEGETKEGDDGLKLKARYLMIADHKTRARMDATTKKYGQATGKLKRMPVSALQMLAASFTDELKTRIREETTSQIVDGWIEVGRQAYGGHKEFVFDEHKKPSESVLEAPVGQCEIWLTASGPSAEHLEFRGAHLPYQTEAVLKHIQHQEGSLADLPIERSIRVAGIAVSPFYVSADGQIDAAALKYMSPDQLVAFANLAKAGERHGDGLEAAALAGMHKVLQALHAIPRSRITESW